MSKRQEFYDAAIDVVTSLCNMAEAAPKRYRVCRSGGYLVRDVYMRQEGFDLLRTASGAVKLVMRGRIEEAGFKTDSSMSAKELDIFARKHGIDCGYDDFAHRPLISLLWIPKFDNYLSYYEGETGRRYIEGEEMASFLSMVDNFLDKEKFFLEKKKVDEKVRALDI